MISRKIKYTTSDGDMTIAYNCPYCETEGEIEFEDILPAGHDTVRCENLDCQRLFVVEWASMIEIRTGKIFFPNSSGLLFSVPKTEEN